MRKSLNIEGCKNLINGIYTQAARDYISAVLSNNKAKEKEAGDFLVSGAYFGERRQGEYIKKKCLEEIKICKQFINEFLDSDLEKILIDEKTVSIKILTLIKTRFYNDKLRIETICKNHTVVKVYLYKK